MTPYPVKVTFKNDPKQRKLIAIKPKPWQHDCRFCALNSTTDPVHPSCAVQSKHKHSSCFVRGHIYVEYQPSI